MTSNRGKSYYSVIHTVYTHTTIIIMIHSYNVLRRGSAGLCIVPVTYRYYSLRFSDTYKGIIVCLLSNGHMHALLNYLITYCAYQFST